MSQDQSKRNLERYLDTYTELPFEVIQEHFRRRALIDFLDSSRFSSVTEIGCGRSSLFEHWRPVELAQTIEPIPSLLNLVREKLALEPVWVGFESRVEEATKIEELKLADLVVVSSILHEVENPKEFLLSIKEITKPGGLIVIIVTNKKSLHRILGVQLGLLTSLDEKTQTEIHMQQSHGAYSCEELKDEIEGADLDLIEIHSIFPKLFSHRQMSDLLEREILTHEFLEVMDNLSPELQEFGSELFAVARRKSA